MNMNKTALDLRQHVLALIARGAEQPASDAEFDKLACAIFAFQYERCETYRAYCDRLKATPQTIEHWKQIPAVPTSAFKDFALTCFPVDEAVAEFHTSGTTQEIAGRHFFSTLELYHAAIKANFAAHLLLDSVAAVGNRGAPDKSNPPRLPSAATEHLPMIVLTPSPQEAPHSSLSHMMGLVMGEFGAAGSRFFVERGALCIERLVGALREVEEARQPVFLLGTAFAFVHLFDHCAASNMRFMMAEGSRAMETGGFKGRSREVSKKQLYEMFEKILGIPTSRVVNEYGMTELSTQFYDQTLREGGQTDRKAAPSWSRVQVIDPDTRKEAKEGERGLIRIYDLANLWSAMCIQTEDLGVASAGGFEILGRAAGAEVRGCSLNAEVLRKL
jgi:acyl-CoA synthetase (AMP-forming)/AMP-acid ligase II